MYNPTKPYKKEILKLIEHTWMTPYVNVRRGLYPIITKRFALPEVQHTDGIGTKGYYHWRERTFRNAAIDALAMNLNDLAMVGAIPYALQNHIVLPRDDHHAILKIVRSLAVECAKYKIAMTGGETSIHDDAQSMDISMTVCGFIKTPIQNHCHAGDVLVGLKSSGLHSNGFTKVREMFGAHCRDAFTRPTKIYLDTVLDVLKYYEVNSMMHITGGAFTKLKDILDDNSRITIAYPHELRPQPIFYELFDRGVSSRQMYTTFNCGVGFVLSVSSKVAEQLIKKIAHAHIIGHVGKGNGEITIYSLFDKKRIIL